MEQARYAGNDPKRPKYRDVFPTPQSRDYKGKNQRANSQENNRDCLPNVVGGSLNPQFVEFLMNYPKDWTDLNKNIELTVSIPYIILVSDKNKGKINGETEKARSGEILSILQEKTISEKLPDSFGGFDCIQKKKILQSDLYGKGNEKEELDSYGCKSKGEKIEKEELSEMRSDREPASTSQRHESMEQQSGQHRNSMCNLPPEMALEPRQEGEQKDEEFQLQGLWRACAEIGHVPTSLSEIPKIWESLDDKEKDWIALRINTGNAWHSEWPGTSRLSVKTKNRANRIKGLGNAILPQIAELLFRQIKDLI